MEYEIPDDPEGRPAETEADRDGGLEHDGDPPEYDQTPDEIQTGNY